jgi:hypothetical protein
VLLLFFGRVPLSVLYDNDRCAWWRASEIPVTLANEAAIRHALEVAGIEFIEENGTGEGVRFRKPRRSRRS